MKSLLPLLLAFPIAANATWISDGSYDHTTQTQSSQCLEGYGDKYTNGRFKPELCYSDRALTIREADTVKGNLHQYGAFLTVFSRSRNLHGLIELDYDETEFEVEVIRAIRGSFTSLGVLKSFSYNIDHNDNAKYPDNIPVSFVLIAREKGQLRDKDYKVRVRVPNIISTSQDVDYNITFENKVRDACVIIADKNSGRLLFKDSTPSDYKSSGARFSISSMKNKKISMESKYVGVSGYKPKFGFKLSDDGVNSYPENSDGINLTKVTYLNDSNKRRIDLVAQAFIFDKKSDAPAGKHKVIVDIKCENS